MRIFQKIIRGKPWQFFNEKLPLLSDKNEKNKLLGIQYLIFYR